jgi:hypothetical protein
MSTTFKWKNECKGYDPTDPANGQKDILVQLVISAALGLSAFLGFCFLRPRWKGLYAARKRQKNAAATLPDLPDSFFGWMGVLYRIDGQQVLASAGLDAYVFLSFFRMAIKFLGVLFLFAAVVIAPINKHFVGLPGFGEPDEEGNNGTAFGLITMDDLDRVFRFEETWGKDSKPEKDDSYLWAYLVFTYLFTALAIYFMVVETKKIIRVRQDYLGSQSTITDRTIRLSGIPEDLRSEDAIKAFFAKLEIGKVESVTLCRDWRELDELMDKRAQILRRLEEAWSVHLGGRGIKRNTETLPVVQPTPDHQVDDEREDSNLLGRLGDHVLSYDKPRPTTRIWYGFLKLQSRKVDAIDYYEEKLRKLDEQITAARKKEYKPTPLAFVTMDSIPACQMAVQALLDPNPMVLLATLAPAPSDVVWPNTYLPRANRMFRSWLITVIIFVLTIIWLAPVGALGTLVNLCSIHKISPRFGDLLSRHDIVKALVQTGLPTLVVSLLNVAVPYLYDYLSNMQGSISQSDVELSVISKNFFFTFFNVFIVFTIFGTAANLYPVLQSSLQDATKIAYLLATSLSRLATFYVNFIMLQGIGLFPFRLLEFGSVLLYPITLMGAKTPRDYAELVQPPLFKYGFYLPSAILILNLCIVYSILPAGYQVLFFGLLYFVIGYFVYKYQLLYAMDHPQHSTGKAWPMICYRVLIGLGIFQLAMAGVIALKQAFKRSVVIIPLLLFTIWFSYFYARTYEPLVKFIALRSIRREGNPDINIADEEIGIERPPGHMIRERATLDENRERGQKFVNPSLTVP